MPLTILSFQYTNTLYKVSQKLMVLNQVILDQSHDFHQ
jgi:hypothetical protein